MKRDCFKNVFMVCFFLLMLAVFPRTVRAQDTSSEPFTYELIGEEITITGYTGNDSIVNIPETIEGYRVRSVGERAFAGCDAIEKVIFREGLKEIGTEAFSGCNNLKDVILPESLTTLGCEVFTSPYITSITIPKNVTNMGNGYNVDYSTFTGCKNLETVVFEKGMKKIPNIALYCCESVKNIDIPEGVKEIGNRAFRRTSIEDLDLPSTLETIEANSIWECEKLKRLVLPDNVSSIGDEAFEGCLSLEEIELNEGLKQIGTEAFNGCDKLKNIVLPESITTLGCEVFTSPFITSITIPKNVTSMGNGYNVDYSTFTGCENLETVVFEEGIEKIPDIALYCCESVKNIEIPEGVKEIGNRAFRRTSIETLDLPLTLEKIGPNSLWECSSLTDVKIPENTREIGAEAFAGCSKLCTVVIYDGVMSVGTEAFGDCPSMIIYGYNGSYIQRYASDNNLDFVILNDSGVEESGAGFDLKEDGHCVENASNAFDYKSWSDLLGISSYKISLERYQEVFGETYTKHIYKQNINNWDGNCFGMSVTAIMFYKNMLPVINYTHDVGTLAAGGYDEMVWDFGKYYLRLSAESELTKLIERYQIWQYSDEAIQSRIKDYINYGSGNSADVYKEILEKIDTIRKPFLVLAFWEEDGNKGHALVVDSARKTQDLGEGWHRIFLYDPNNPYFGYFDDKTPKDCYKQAENRYVDVNTINGQWRMSATVNGDGKGVTDIGYDSEGNLLRKSSLYFVDVNDYPTDFEQKATFSPSGGGIEISYTSDDFEIYDSAGILIFKMENGETSYIEESRINQYTYCGYMGEVTDADASGRLVVPRDTYTIQLENGSAAFLSDGDYIGIVTDGSASVTNNSSTGLTVSADTEMEINVVVEDIHGNSEFTSISTDMMLDGNESTVFLDGDELTIDTDSSQDVAVDVITEDGETILDNISTDDVKNMDVTETIPETEHVKGDVDGSGKVDISDLRMVLRKVCGKIQFTEAQVSVADVEADGKVDIADLRKILRFVCGKIETL